MEEGEKVQCRGCSCTVTEPYIHCMECSPQVFICLHCFARGCEFNSHHSDHQYEVIKNDFTLLEAGWTAQEELRLLQAITDYGLGNWHDISNKLPGKTALQCERHYHTHLTTNMSELIPEIQEVSICRHPAPVPMRFCEHPPRPSEGSSLHQDLSGYMAARGDFIVEQANFAEVELRDINFSHFDTAFDHTMKLAVVDVYHRVVKERHRRKRFIRDHGIINIRRPILHCGISQDQASRLRSDLAVFMQLTQPDEWALYQAGLHYELELKQRIRHLQSYRQAGVKRLHSARVYNELLSRRQEAQKQRSALLTSIASIQSDRACEEWLQKQGVTERINKGLPVHIPQAARRSAPPLHIVGMPGYDKLSETEKKLCSVVRFVPESFLEFKRILITENKKLGFLRLAQARTLIKIDVNKTRKLYDFLVKTGNINKEPTCPPAAAL